MPKAQNLYYYMDEDYFTINRVYGLLSKSYDPKGEHLKCCCANSDTNLCKVGGRGTNETGSIIKLKVLMVLIRLWIVD